MDKIYPFTDYCYKWPLPLRNGMSTISCANRKRLRAKRKSRS